MGAPRTRRNSCRRATYWDPVIAPGGMVFYDGAMFPDWQGDILAAGLVAQSVVRLDLDQDTVTGEERLAEGVGPGAATWGRGPRRVGPVSSPTKADASSLMRLFALASERFQASGGRRSRGGP